MDFSSSEATPLMLKSQDDDDGKHKHHQPDHHHHASTSFESDSEPPITFTRVHRNKYRQQTASGRKRHHHRKGSSFLSFGSGILNFTNKTTTNNKQQQQHQQQHHQHRRSPTSSIFNFGSTIIQELTHDFTDYQESESIALNALFSIAQPIIITGEDLGEEQVVVVEVEEEQGNFASSDTYWIRKNNYYGNCLDCRGRIGLW